MFPPTQVEIVEQGGAFTAQQLTPEGAPLASHIRWNLEETQRDQVDRGFCGGPGQPSVPTAFEIAAHEFGHAFFHAYAPFLQARMPGVTSNDTALFFENVARKVRPFRQYHQ